MWAVNKGSPCGCPLNKWGGLAARVDSLRCVPFQNCKPSNLLQTFGEAQHELIQNHSTESCRCNPVRIFAPLQQTLLFQLGNHSSTRSDASDPFEAREVQPFNQTQAHQERLVGLFLPVQGFGGNNSVAGGLDRL